MNNKTIDYKFEAIPEIKLPKQMNDFPCVKKIEEEQLIPLNKIIAEFNENKNTETLNKIDDNEDLIELVSKYLTGEDAVLAPTNSAVLNIIGKDEFRKTEQGQMAEAFGKLNDMIKQLKEITPAFEVADNKKIFNKDGDSFGRSSEEFKEKYGEDLFTVYSDFIKALERNLNKVDAYEQ